MIVAFPVCVKDQGIAYESLRWMKEMGDDYRHHQMVLVASSTVSDSVVDDMVHSAKDAGFTPITLLRMKDEQAGWPAGPNMMFRAMAEHARKSASGSFLWLEPDAVPLCSGWLDKLEGEYRSCKKPFMGVVYDKPFPHMTGVGIYPHDIARYNRYVLGQQRMPFDVVRPDLTIRHLHQTSLIHHEWGDSKTNVPWTFDTAESVERIREGAVIFHRCKDGSLLHRLRERTYGEQPKPTHGDEVEVKVRERLQLTNVTLWSSVWSDNREILGKVIRVLRYCHSLCNFQRIALFTCIPPDQPDFPLDIVQIPKIGMDGWNIFVNRIVPLAIDSEFAMSVHEDGFPTDVSMWRKEFLGYDYIGAPWKDGVVGNGGFNIESRKLFKAKLRIPFSNPAIPSDFFVCRNNRARLEQEGIRFAPAALASLFSRETVETGKPSFGFHGRNHNRPAYNTGWSLIEKSELEDKTTVALVYIHVPWSEEHLKQTRSFVESYRKFPPGIRHRTIVVSQKQPIAEDYRRLFSNFPDVTFVTHDNSGHDIGAYIAVAKTIPDDMMMCVGTSTFFNAPGWLARMVQAWRKHGPGLYGTNATYEVSPHMNTTGFLCPPSLLATYPIPVNENRSRYDFEHGPNALWKLASQNGITVKLVTWDGEYGWTQWRKPANGFRRGDQSNCVTMWHHHLDFVAASYETRKVMEKSADTIIDPLYADLADCSTDGKSTTIADIGRIAMLAKKSESLFARCFGNCLAKKQP